MSFKTGCVTSQSFLFLLITTADHELQLWSFISTSKSNSMNFKTGCVRSQHLLLALTTDADHRQQLWSFISTSRYHWCLPQMLITDYSSSQSSARDCITLQIVTIQHLMSLVLTTKAEHKPQLWSFISTKLTSSFCELVTCQRLWKRLMGLSVGHTYCVVLLLASDVRFRV